MRLKSITIAGHKIKKISKIDKKREKRFGVIHMQFSNCLVVTKPGSKTHFCGKYGMPNLGNNRWRAIRKSKGAN